MCAKCAGQGNIRRREYKMDEDKILDVVWDNHEEWTDKQIGTFVRKALTEDITQEDLEKEIEADERWRRRI